MEIEIISAGGVSKNYFGRPILKNLNLKVKKGAFTVLLGKNGSGKSTLLRLIAGIEPIDQGEISIFGSNIDEENLDRRRKVAYVSEITLLDPTYSLKKATEIYRPMQPQWDEDCFNRFIKTFNLSVDKVFGSLSRGQKVQFFFALAAASRPDLYLLDEVTSVLDANARFEVMNHIRKETHRGANVILATNIATETHNFANEIILISGGSVELQCSVDDLQKKFFKFRFQEERRENTKIPKHARPVHLNGDGSISYLIPVNFADEVQEIGMGDNRGITIEDIFVYYTGPEVHE